MEGQASWYVVHTYSGYENKVAQDLMTKVENQHLEEQILDCKVPAETVMEEQLDRRGNHIGEKETQHKLYPGYVFVKMVMNDNSWYIVRNTRGCTGFVGAALKPEALSDEEVAKMGLENESAETGSALPRVDYKVGDMVEIVSGPMEGSAGTVDSIDLAHRKVVIKITMFGREMPAELALHEVRAF